MRSAVRPTPENSSFQSSEAGVSYEALPSPYQCVLAGVMDHPSFLHHCAASPLGVLDRLHHPHEGDVVACRRA